MTAEVLWALDLDENGLPWQAHKIVDPPAAPENGKWPEVLTASCGEKFNRFSHAGWWSVPPQGFPLAEHGIHCGAS